MYKITEKVALNPTVTKMVIEAPLIAKKAKPGQFIIVRPFEDSERIPLTVAGYDREKGTVDIIFQIVGGTTMELNSLEVGQSVHDFVGPLGRATEVEGLKKVCVVGGGVGCAIALPIARELHEQGCVVHSVVGFRSKDLLILEDEFKACSDELRIMTDDGSYGTKGVVTAALDELVASGNQYDLVITIGPLIMMKFGQDLPEARPQEHRLHEPHHDRRHRHVRRLPPDRGRRDQVRLRGWPRLRRRPRGFRRGNGPRHHVPPL